MKGPAVPDATKGRRVVSQPDQAASSLDGEPDRSTFASAHGDDVPNLCGMVLSERGIFAGCLALVDPKHSIPSGGTAARWTCETLQP